MQKKIGLKEAISIGIGGMVGGGIFAVLGLAVSLAKGGTPVAFLFAGILALITSYSYAKLSQTYPDRGGTVKFVNQGFGVTVFSGAINNLLWLSYIIMLSLYASAFGSYAPNLWEIMGDKKLDFHLFASFIILFATIINYYSIAVVGKIESYAVIIKLIILLAFVAIGGYGLMESQYISQLSISHWESPVKLFAGGMVIFVAYEGFELIANAVPDLVNPEKNVSRAYYISVIFVILLYIVIAYVTVGSLPFSDIARAQDYVLAEAAKPMLGKVGFTIITIAALISTFSAINASLYGGSQVNYEIAEDKELPHHFLGQLWGQPIGLMITAVSTFVLVNTLDLESISTAGSLGFILIFGVVNLVNLKCYKSTNSVRIIPLLGTILSAIAFVILVNQQWQENKLGIYVSAGIILFCFLVEWVYKKYKK
ncbi:APC family permease [Ornithobacterium rhinotracheale]|uniref:Amino acid transporter n=2 Tax=Ornithobacterium rhinotracheale TaxID=28251 RepID=I3ZXN6_ORNRL|nr:APC family permease [Ornithobacterium rhinotracheale]AFL96470.1 amino acid transporter [Ornithobacterium rhinotracheale DSM 15997]AIP98679.1 amino acid transporter [Ornithobacterium rhinotracheale ORT-UMN 88]KGB67667.1 amino acid transporter [Ornithobacterium rhinotracheale H06-030791]MCK0194798.1 APC family permease [Ornithobacterium rhinotracheale]MCK0200735.1 APC family permease [Ornithobacterium rhinotracheale]